MPSRTFADSSPSRTLSPGPRGRPPLPQGPRVPNKRGQSQSIRLTINASPVSSTSRLTSSPTLSLPPIAQGFLPDSIPPSYVESPYSPVIHSPFPVKAAAQTATFDVGVQATPTPPVTSPADSKPAVKIIPKPVALVPPPQIKFESVPIPFKGLSLEAAQWTFSSTELQEVVSRAIRLSSRESFIRVLPIETLDTDLTKEKDRLATLKMTTQAQYRFQVHRRTMLLQALNSSAVAIPPDPGAACSLVGQLSETTAACDRLMEELLRVADQQAQLAKVLDLHWASALAIALRKINKSYERRVAELRSVQEQVEVLEAELKDAWKEAEEIALEIDEIEGYGSEDEGEYEGDDITTHTARVVGVTGTATVTEAKLMNSTEASASQIFGQVHSEPPAPEDHDRSRPSSRNSRTSRSTRVIAAKTRSRRTSDASLRVTQRSRSRARYAAEGKAPPVPTLPTSMNVSEISFLEFDPNSPSPDNVPNRLYSTARPEKTHLFSSNVNRAAVPSIWISADVPIHHSEEQDRLDPMSPFPLVRHDSARRSTSEYSLLKPKPKVARHSVPPGYHIPRSETP